MNDVILVELTANGLVIVDSKTFYDSNDPDNDAYDWCQKRAQETGKRLMVYAFETEVFPSDYNLR